LSRLRNLLRIVSLIGAVVLLLYGLAAGAQPQETLEPPSDAVWLICLAAAFPLLLLFSYLSVGGDPDRKLYTSDARFRHNVQQLGGFLLVGFGLLSMHLLREQVVAAAAIRGTTITTEAGDVIQDPRKVPELLKVRRGRIMAGDRVIASSEVVSPSQYVHRVYPEPDMSYLAGYYNPTIYGNAGLEASFDRWLSGGEALDPLLEQQRRLLNRPVVGNDLYLTIDPAMQELAHRALGQRKGAVVLLDAQSGAILALASYPHIDPQQMSFNPYANAGNWTAENKRIIEYYNSILQDEDRPLVLRATQGIYPPGSTFKTVAAAAAIDTNLAEPTSVFTDADGTIKVEAGNYVHRDCATCRPRNHGPRYTLTEAYKWSLNAVFAELGVKLGAPRMEEYAQRFGFGTRYDIGIPVEASRVTGGGSGLSGLNLLAATAYGQGEVQATPLQMAIVAATVAKGGEVPTPYLVQSVNEPESGRALWRFEPRPLKRALSVNTNEKLKEMMITSVESGWATAAKIPGATVGGKTGTAETGADSTHSWFIGFAGKDKARPQYAIAVVVEDGGEGTRVALPVARQVLVGALQR
jgi:peptidoglycan glycosyltransferase